MTTTTPSNTTTSPFVLSPGQRAIWFAQQTNPTSTEYQCAELLTFEGSDVDTELLAAVIRDCLGGLRVFQVDYDDPYHAADWPQTVSVTFAELADDVDLQQWAAQQIIEVTDPALRGETLTKHWIMTTPSGKAVWLARFHHITGDGFAINALLNWLGGVYSARLAGGVEPECPLNCDFSGVPDEPVAPEVAEYWAQAGVRAPESIMSETPADDVMVMASAVVPVAVREQLRSFYLGDLNLLAELVLQYVLAFDAPDAERWAVGLPLMNRPIGQKLVDLAPQVAVLPLVAELQYGDSIDFDVNATRKHANIRTDQLRQVLGVRDPRQHVLGPHVNFRPFTPKFSFGPAVAYLTTISVGPINDCEFVFQSLPHGDLEVIVMARGSNLQGDVSTHARRLANMLSRLPEHTLLKRLPIATDAELTEIAAANETEHPVELHNLPEMILTQRTNAESLPVLGRPMLGVWSESDGAFMWRLWAQVSDAVDKRIAVLQQDVRVKPGHVVAVHVARSEEFLLAVAAAAQLGVAWCPIDPDLPAERKAQMLASCQAAAVITVEPIETDITVVTATDAGWVVSQRAELPAAGDPEFAYILFTSGSTGTPKAVAVSQQGIVNRLLWMCEYYSIDHTDRVLHKTPSSFDVSVWEYLLPFTMGVPTAIAAPQAHRNPEELAQQLQAGGITVCHFVPSALKAFLGYADYAGVELPDLRAVITSGEALDVGVANRCRSMFGVDVHNLYGPTEAAIDVTAHTVTDADRIVPIGAPVWNNRIYVLDRLGHPVPPGVPGTLFIAGCQVALGYVGQPELTAQRFVPDPWHEGEQMYDSGDRAYWRDGELYYLGRLDNQVKLRGQRLELGEVESAVSAVPGVAQAAVAIKEVGGEKTLVAYCVPTQDTDQAALPATVTNATKAVLPAFMVPSFMFILDELPMTRNGKLDAPALPSPVAQPAEITVECTPTERHVMEVFTEVLGTPVTDPGANFFALGGSSLSAVTLALALEGVSIADVFAHSTVEALAQLIDAPGLAGDGFAEVLTLHAHQSGTPVLCFYPAGGLSWSYSTLVGALAAVGFTGGVYGFQAPGILDVERRATSIVDSAARICEHVSDLGHDSVVLVGWSVGGVLAHEVARQLQDRGVGVGKVILLDAYPAEVWQKLPAPDDKQLWQGVLAMAGITSDADLSPDEVVAAMRSRGGVFAELPVSALDGIRTMVKHNALLMRAHESNFYSGEVVHFTADAESAERDPRLVVSAWEPFVQSVVAHHVPVRHPGMVSLAVLEQVAGIIVR
ncbi:MAG: amino acid adenylation domain-containing protein [Corynebacterium sp.]|nr:amino acid adenylation domain-containing protein [Corynebacterium sp.]